MNVKNLYRNGILIVLFLLIIIKPFNTKAESINTYSNVDETIINYDSSWNITASSIHTNGWENNDILNAFDGNINTYWHTDYVEDGGDNTNKDDPPFTITIIFPSEKLISGWLYTPRIRNGTGTILAYNIYASTDGIKYKKIYTGTFDYDESVLANHEPKGASWGNVKMKAIKIEITNGLYGYGSAAEINFYTETPNYLFDYKDENVGRFVTYRNISDKKFVRLNFNDENFLDEYRIFSATYDKRNNELTNVVSYSSCGQDFDITTNKLIIFSLNNIRPLKYNKYPV